MRYIGTLLTLASGVVMAQVRDVRPKIVAPELCGVVTDSSGVPVAKAEVSAMVADFGSFVTSDASGKWGFAGETGSRWVMVKADGFETLIFDYRVSGTQKKVPQDQPAFICGAGQNDWCKKPIYVRLVITGSSKGFVTLNSQQGLEKGK